jgi:hypothetical protein
MFSAIRRAKREPDYLVRTPTNGVHYDVPTLDKAISTAKDILDVSTPGQEVRIYQLVRTIRYPIVAEMEEFEPDSR